MDELEVLRIRDEVLQAMYWMSSEGLADHPTANELARFLAVPGDTLILEVQQGRVARGLGKYTGVAKVKDVVVAEAELLCALREL